MLLCHLRHPDWYVSRLQTIRYGTLAQRLIASSERGELAGTVGEPSRRSPCTGPFPAHRRHRPSPSLPQRGAHGQQRGTWVVSTPTAGGGLRTGVRLVGHSSSCRTLYRCFSGRDSALEAFRHNPTDVASLHWPLGQERNQMSGTAVPLVLSRTAVATT